MNNFETLPDQELRSEILKYQSKLSGGWVSFPYNCVCSCGHDFTTDDSSLTELKSGCPNCHKSYCE